jgi:hypothetical protein
VAHGCAVHEPKDGVVVQGCNVHETAVAHGCAVMSMDGLYFAMSQEGGAINEPKDGEDGMTN